MLDRFSLIAKIGTPDQFGKFIADQATRWGELVRLRGPKSSSATALSHFSPWL